MHTQTDVVKAHGARPTESFDPEKLKQSIVATCRSLKVPDGQAEEIAALVVKGVSEWCHDKAEITSNDIRRIGSTILAKYHIEAAYLYKQQLTVL